MLEILLKNGTEDEKRQIEETQFCYSVIQKLILLMTMVLFANTAKTNGFQKAKKQKQIFFNYKR